MDGHFNVGDVVFGNWTLVKELGQGSYGKVYEARRDDYGTYKSAIKIITIPKTQNEVTAVRAMGMDDASATSYFHGFVDRVAQEFALMSKLQGTANIVGYYDHAAIPHTNGFGWDVIIRMELLTPLLTHVVNHKMQNYDVVKLGIDMCRALEVCQRQSIMHRDIKPENIFISDFGDYKLGDFGIARTLEATTGATKAGTYKYMAPEIYKEEPYNFSVDIYSLGIVLYQLLNGGRLPFLPMDRPIQYSDDDAALVKRMSGESLPPPVNADEHLAEVVLKACAYLPQDRYEKPEQMRSELESILMSMPVPEPSEIEGVPSADADGETPLTDASGSGETVGMYGDRPPAANPSGSGETVGMYGARPPAANPSGSGETVGMYGDRPSVANPSGSGENVDMNDYRKRGLLIEKSKFFADGKNAKKYIIAGSAAAALILLAIIIFPLGKKNNNKAEVPNEESTSFESAKNHAEKSDPSPASDPVVSDEEKKIEIDWSDWMEKLPDGITGESNAVECRLVYQSTPLFQVSSSEKPPEGAVLFDSYYTDWSEWGAWKSSKIEANDLREVQKDSTSTWSDWSPWSQTKVTASSTREVQKQERGNNGIWTVTEYRYRTLSGATRYRSRTRQLIGYYYNPAAWSELSETPIPQSDDILVSYQLQYRYNTLGGQINEAPAMDNFPRFSEDAARRFRDVDDNAWYGANKSDILRTVSDLGIFLPDSYMRFCPDQRVTVGEAIRAAVMINRIYNGYGGLLTENDGNYQPYADYAVNNHIIKEGEFVDLARDVTRQEMAYIFYNALPESEFASLKQIGAISDMGGYWYYNYALAMAQAGVVNLNAQNQYRPEDTATRAEVASIIDKLIYPENRAGAK